MTDKNSRSLQSWGISTFWQAIEMFESLYTMMLPHAHHLVCSINFDKVKSHNSDNYTVGRLSLSIIIMHDMLIIYGPIILLRITVPQCRKERST